MSSSSPSKPINNSNDEFIICLRPDYIAGQPENDLEHLWAKVRFGDIGSFEAVHKILYPVVFKYGRFCLKDEKLTDAVAEDVFVKFWIKRKSIRSNQVKIQLMKMMRKEVLNHLPSIVIDYHRFDEHEALFLRHALGFEYHEILEIMFVDDEPVFDHIRSRRIV